MFCARPPLKSVVPLVNADGDRAARDGVGGRVGLRLRLDGRRQARVVDRPSAGVREIADLRVQALHGDVEVAIERQLDGVVQRQRHLRARRGRRRLAALLGGRRRGGLSRGDDLGGLLNQVADVRLARPLLSKHVRGGSGQRRHHRGTSQHQLRTVHSHGHPSKKRNSRLWFLAARRPACRPVRVRPG